MQSTLLSADYHLLYSSHCCTVFGKQCCYVGLRMALDLPLVRIRCNIGPGSTKFLGPPLLHSVLTSRRRGHATGVFLWPKVHVDNIVWGRVVSLMLLNCCPGGSHVGITPKWSVSYIWCCGRVPKRVLLAWFVLTTWLRRGAWWLISSHRSSRTSGFVQGADACPGSGCWFDVLFLKKVLSLFPRLKFSHVILDIWTSN